MASSGRVRLLNPLHLLPDPAWAARAKRNAAI
jgi:hypothetical protein